MRVAGRTLVVTGAGGGIGRALTLEAVRRGARVAATDVDAGALGETARQVVAPLLLSTHVLDLSDPAVTEALPSAVIRRWSEVDGLIHCAGSGRGAADPVFRVFQPALRVRPEAHLVEVAADHSGRRGRRVAAKRLTEGLRAAYAGTNVHVTAVFPHRASTPYQAARDVLDGMERNASRVLIGAEAGLIDRLIPARLRALLS
ncbi:SDR family NAD(P)-dependent oxidoreductase [Actinoplanes siamensis]|uniref:Short-chain dehydrogenase n=1 Tax=Actinoplanes siamensis TaxID=1223317 RepID=A0A919TJ20_9ACTN|nr:SDR family oxidoreductase [Actinoplanes siamensis]GIF04283.1 short-chain dehydrogenase [Actinoplanes siamensis]